MPKNPVLAHELDVAWIIALWLAIHGGDPSPVEVSAAAAERIANALQAALPEQALKRTRIGPRILQTQLKGMRVELTQVTPRRPQEQAVETWNPPHQYCFKYKGKTYCVTIRAPVYRTHD